MNNSHQPEDSLSNSEESLADLAWAIEGSLGQFSLILARCNYVSLQEKLVQRLQQLTPVEIRVIQLQPSVQKLYQTIQIEIGNEPPPALMILGLDSVKEIDRLLKAANQVREEFRQNFPFPMVWWVNDEVLQKLIRLAPDFESWGTTTEFAIASAQLVDLLRQSSHRVFSAILEAGGSQFLTNAAILGGGYRLEIESASRYLQLEAELEASLQFIWGREDYQCDRIDEALSRYQESLAFWQSSQSSIPKNEALQRQGILLSHIGLCHCRKAELERHESRRHWQNALGYFQQLIQIFEQLKSPELVAKFINQTVQILQRLELWQELEILAKKSLALHQRYGSQVQLVQDYGFLAEVALARSQWRKGNKLALQALAILNQLPANLRQFQGLSLLLLGRSQHHLGELNLAVRSLEQAKAESNPQEDSRLYIRILEKLRSLYLEQGEYLKAFDIKQYQRLIERQYGLRGFIGAGRLQPQVVETVAVEIAASGREQDVKRLAQRVYLPQHKLTVIYGQSGVGKSSVLEAGLVPLLKDKSVGTRDILPIYIRVYTDWINTLGKGLADVLREKGETTIEGLTIPEDLAIILEQLRDNEAKNIVTVLILDQFEEFFFACQDREKRRLFFQFLRDCWQIPFVKVILSLREDYLHLLLEGCRRIDLGAINNNILDKDILYYLGNFALEDTRDIIRSLTAKSQFNLEDALVDRLVTELAAELGEVRPIELQVVGAQLQTEGITTLDKYLEIGSKERLVARYLEEVIEDCGGENQKTAELVLYLLTDENGNRPLKTCPELSADLVATDNLDLVLEILVKSGLVFEIPEVTANRYQLVHDYLVSLIRQRQEADNLAQLKREIAQRELAEAELKRVAEANQILEDAKRKANQKIRLGFAVLTFSIVGLIGISISLGQVKSKLEYNLTTLKQKATELTKADSQKQIAEAKTKAAQETLVSTQGNLKKVTQEVTQKSAQLQTAYQKEKAAKQGLALAIQKEKEAREGLSLVKAKEQETRKGLAIVSEKEQQAREQLDRVSQKERDAEERLDAATQQKREAEERLDAATQQKREAEEKAELAQQQRQEAEGIFQEVQAKLQQAETEYKLAQQKLEEAEEGRKLEQVATIGLQQFQSSQIEALISVMRSGRKLQELVKDSRSLQDYPAIGPLKSLQSILENIRESNQLQGDKGWLMSGRFSPDGKYIVTGGEDNIAKLWTASGQFIEYLKRHQGKIWSVRFSPDRHYIATGSADGTVKIWDTSGEFKKSWETKQGEVLNIDLSPDGQYIATAGEDGTGIVWNREGKQISPVLRHNENSKVTSIAFTPDGKEVATAGEDGKVQLWDLSGVQINNPWTKGDGKAIFSISFSPDGKYLATAQEDGIVRLWDLSDVSQEKVIQFTANRGLVLSVSFSPDGKYLATGGEDGTTRLWNLSGEEIAEPFRGHLGLVISVSFSPDSQKIISTGSDGIARIWHINQEEIIKVDAEFATNQDGVSNISFSPDGEKIATGGVNGTVKLWTLSGQTINTFKGHRGTVWSVNFSPDGQYVVTGGEDKTTRLWNSSGKELHNFRDCQPNSETPDPDKCYYHRGWVTSVNFSPDGKYIATASIDGTAIIWHRDGKAVALLESGTSPVLAVSFTPDGQEIVTGKQDGTVRFWDLSGKPIGEALSGYQDAILSLSFSPDRKYLATASADGTAIIWDLSTRTQIAQLKGHRGLVNSVSFNPDINRGQIVTAGADGTIKLWNLYGQQMAELKGNMGKIISVKFSPDGQRLAAVGEDGRVKIWNLNQLGLDELLAKGCTWLKDYLSTHPNVSDVCPNH